MKVKIAAAAAGVVLLAAVIALFASQYTPSNILNYVRACHMEIENGVLTVPEKYTVIEAEAFAGRIEFDTVIVEGKTNIESRAFYNCTNLANVVIEDECEIGEEAFADCPALKSIVCLSAGGSCAENAFGGHGGATVRCHAGSPVWDAAVRADMNVRELE